MNLLEPIYYFVYLKSTLSVTGLWNRGPMLLLAYDTKLILDDQGGNILRLIQNPSDKPVSVTGQVHFSDTRYKK